MHERENYIFAEYVIFFFFKRDVSQIFVFIFVSKPDFRVIILEIAIVQLKRIWNYSSFFF